MVETRVQRRVIFLVVCFLMIYMAGFGQKNPQKIWILHNNLQFGYNPGAESGNSVMGRTTLNSRVIVQPVAPGNYVKSLGIICRKEWELDKISPLAFRFRLGSLDYVNWLEQKPNSTNRH